MVSPFAPAAFPALPAVDGVRFATAAAGVKYKGRVDVMLAELAAGTTVAGVYTRSATRSAPVLWCQERTKAKPVKGKQAIIVNSGNSNAFTGAAGIKSVEETAKAVAAATGAAQGGIYIASTGVIGQPLPHERITAKLEEMTASLSPDGIEGAARAIMTTDTFPKGASAMVALDGVPVTISGFAKGSGMIAPDMATMLSFVFTDAPIARPLLQRMLRDLTETTFNSITVDSDTSTSDTLLLAATGKAGGKPIRTMRDSRAATFRDALEGVLMDLAHQVAKDGEGATKFVEIEVTGAKTPRAAKVIGMAIANSPLVKTALAGEDPNWGRIVMAVGKSGEAADRDKLAIRFGDIQVAENGWVSESYREELGAAYMKNAELKIGVDVGVGEASAKVWTCDLTHQYITINADYRS
jgi:glutamate N-acetyltransferase/amino-acid N-acetyltransferase